MKENENMHGTLVLIDPDLENDPFKSQGQVAFIKYAPENREEIYVGLLDGREAFYHPKELMRLKDTQSLFNELRDNTHLMALPDIKALYKVYLYQDRGTNTARVQALELVRDNPSIRGKATEPIASVRQERANQVTR